MYDWLLFFHLLAAFLLAVTVVMYSAVALGATASGRMLFVADRCWDVGGLGTLVLGIWLALHLDEYGFFDGWIIGAIVLWIVATGLGETRAQAARGAEASPSRRASPTMHWLRTLAMRRPAGPDDLEAGRMSLLAAIRPDDWNLALFVHVLGAMVLVGALVLVATSRRRATATVRLGYRTLLIAVDPGWIVMRVARAVDRLEGEASTTSTRTGLGRHRVHHVRGQPPAAHRGDDLLRDRGATRHTAAASRTATLVLVGITLIAYVVAIWAMSTKPDVACLAMVVAIDGPAGAGKSTVARAAARALGFTYLDSGAMYRAVGLMTNRHGGPAAERAEELDIGLGERVLANGEDVTEAIRAPEVSEAASKVATNPRVREALVKKQRELLSDGDWVAEGRDIGTVVAPDAAVKVYLTASPEERARRRAAELGTDVETVMRDQALRDAQDMDREHSPLMRGARRGRARHERPQRRRGGGAHRRARRAGAMTWSAPTGCSPMKSRRSRSSAIRTSASRRS